MEREEREKRRHPRTKVFRSITCEGVDCEIQDVSDTGACVIINRPYEPGSLVKLSYPSPRLARVVWKEGLMHDKFVLGLMFLL
jgi:hypothetical protein